MLVVIEPPDLNLSPVLILEEGHRQQWTPVSVLFTEFDYALPGQMIPPRAQVWRHEGRFLSWDALRYLVTGNHHGNSHDGMTPPTPRGFFQSPSTQENEQFIDS